MGVLEEGLGEETAWSRSTERIQTHYSSMGLHRKCPNAWHFRYGIGLGKPFIGPAPYLHYGSWFGAIRTAEALVRGRKAESLIQTPRRFKPIDDGPEFDMRTMTPKDVLAAAVEWWKYRTDQDPEEAEAWHKALGEDLPHRLKGGFLRWHDEYGEASKREAPLAVEMFWKRALPRPSADQLWDPTAADMPEIVLIGFIDELYHDLDKNIVVVRDNKTTSRALQGMTSLDDLADSQLQLYAWGVTPALHDANVPPPRALSYDRAMSSKPTEPRLNLNGTLSAATKLYDLRTYREWAATDTRPQSLEELQRIAIENTSTKTRTSDWEESWTEDQRRIMLALLESEPGRVYGNIGQFTAAGAPKFGIYREEPEVVQRLSAKDWRSQWHQRTLTPVNRQVIQAHLRSAVDTATDIWRTQTRAKVTYEGARSMSKDNCRWCDYVHLCRAQMFGGADGVYDIREFGLRHKEGVILEKGVVRERE